VKGAKGGSSRGAVPENGSAQQPAVFSLLFCLPRVPMELRGVVVIKETRCAGAVAAALSSSLAALISQLTLRPRCRPSAC
jgi:hypothetical protein